MTEPGIRPQLPGWRRAKAAPTTDPLTLDRIIAAAIELVDREGLDALSMRRLGTELGAGATTLYWHVKNKDELLDLALDEVFRTLPVPGTEGSWRDRAAALARGLRAVLLRHRNLIMVIASRPTTGPNALGAMDAALGIMRDGGFPDELVVDAALAIINYTSGYTVLEAAALQAFAGSSEEARREAIEASGRGVVEFILALPPEEFPNLTALGRRFLDGDDTSRFEYGLQRILDGLEADLARSRR